MGDDMKRRKLLERSAIVAAAGATAGAAVPAAASAGPRRTSTKVGTVVTAHGTARVEVAVDGSSNVTVPTDGFPDGWQLRAGDRVVVTDIDGTLVAAPLLTRIIGDLDEAAGTIRVADTTVSLQPATLQHRAGTAGYEAHYVENANGLLPGCVSLRPRGQATQA
jgi:hypothetical protein